MRKLFLKDNWLYASLTKGVAVFSITTGRQFIFLGDKQNIVDVLARLRKGATKDSLLREMDCQTRDRQEAAYIVDKLVEINAVENHSYQGPRFASPYFFGLDRQLAFFQEIYPAVNPKDTQKKIKESCIAILGTGSVGGYLVSSLLAAGAGNFLLVDFDKVEKCNLGRQLWFGKEDVGRLKVEVIKQRVGQIKGGIKVKEVVSKLAELEQVKQVIKDADIVVQCCDEPRFLIHRTITKACLVLGKPTLVVTSGRVGPFCLPSKTACYGCYEEKYRRNFPPYNQMVEEMSGKDNMRLPGLETANPLIASLAAREIVNHILGIRPETYDNVIMLQIPCLTISRIRLKRDKSCSLCGLRTI